MQEPTDYAALNRAVEEIDQFPFPQRDQIERIARKLRYLGLSTPEDRLCDEAQGGLGFILCDIADEMEGIADDLREEGEARLAAFAKQEAQS